MRIYSSILDENHWSSEWIPISYNSVLTKAQLKNSKTFLWKDGYTVLAIARGYKMSPNRIEIGDVWLNPMCRGKRDEKGRKLSSLFFSKVISKIWQTWPRVSKITLIVEGSNIPAIKLYERLHFHITKKDVKSLSLSIKNGFIMERRKR